jgi:glycogen synthase
MERAMNRDFSWAKAAEQYEEIYASLVGHTGQAAA